MTQNPPLRGKPGLVIVLLVLALIVAAADQLTKIFAEERLTPGVIVPLIGDYLGWQLIYNPGAAFSMATGMTWVLTVVALVVVVVVLRVSRRLRSVGWAVALGLLLGGAAGNLVDRLTRDPGPGRGHVVDFINYNGWFVGNVADIAIVLAAVIIAVLALRGVEIDGRRISAERGAAAVEGDVDEEEAGLLSEDPLADDEEAELGTMTPASDDDVDLARWVTDAEPAREHATVPADLSGDAEPDEERSPVAGAVDAPGPAAERSRAAAGARDPEAAVERSAAVGTSGATEPPAGAAVAAAGTAEVTDPVRARSPAADPVRRVAPAAPAGRSAAPGSAATTRTGAGATERRRTAAPSGASGAAEQRAEDAPAEGSGAGAERPRSAASDPRLTRPTAPPRRWRSRREMRAATEDPSAGDD